MTRTGRKVLTPYTFVSGDILRPVLLAVIVQGALFGSRNSPWLFDASLWWLHLFLLIMLPLVVIALIAVYALKFLGQILFHNVSDAWPLLAALVILAAPEGLIRAGFCFQHLHFSTNEDLIRYAIDGEIQKKRVSSEIRAVEQFYERYDRERCCLVKEDKDYFRDIPSAPWYINAIDDFFSGPTAEVAISYESKIRHIQVGFCGGIVGRTFTKSASPLTPRFGRLC